MTHNQEKNQSECDSVTMYICDPIPTPLLLIQCSIHFHEPLTTPKEPRTKEGEPQLVKDGLNNDRDITVNFNA